MRTAGNYRPQRPNETKKVVVRRAAEVNLGREIQNSLFFFGIFCNLWRAVMETFSTMACGWGRRFWTGLAAKDRMPQHLEDYCRLAQMRRPESRPTPRVVSTMAHVTRLTC